MADNPLCFILMPFGKKPDPTGKPDINFDRIYDTAIRPAIQDAGMVPIRADEERTGGIIHTAMFERLLLCEYAVADMTTANANVFYELGVRHTARPRTTQAIFATHQPIPFDVSFLRALPYELGEQNRFSDDEASALRKALATRLQELRELNKEQDTSDSPVFALIADWRPDIAHIKTDIFRDQVKLNEKLREEMAAARAAGESGVEKLQAIEARIGDIDKQEVGALVDLMLSYRALAAWPEMIALYEKMPEHLKRQVMVREQLAFALNRHAGKTKQTEFRDRALQVLEEVERERGANPETCGLIGRIYKDRWDEIREIDQYEARGHLRSAIAAYRRGFQADWRDAYPGINAVTLLEIEASKESLRARDELLPVVKFSTLQRLAQKEPDYWDHATMLELSVLEGNREAADGYLGDSLSAVRESWEPETTARNLKLIRDARAQRQEPTNWIEQIIKALTKKMERMKNG